MCVCFCMHGLACALRPEVDLRVSSLLLSTSFLKIKSLTDWLIPARRLQGCSCPCLPSASITGICHHTYLFHVGRRGANSGPTLAWQALHTAISLAPCLCICLLSRLGRQTRSHRRMYSSIPKSTWCTAGAHQCLCNEWNQCHVTSCWIMEQEKPTVTLSFV